MWKDLNNQSRARRTLFLTFWLLTFAVMWLPFFGCSSVGSRRVPDDSRSPSTGLVCKSQGLPYFLPLGRVHILATRNEIYITNYGTMQEVLSNGQKITNFVTKLYLDTNTVTRTWTTNAYAPIPSAGSVTLSNQVSVVTNQFAQTFSSYLITTNLAATTNFLATNAVPLDPNNPRLTNAVVAGTFAVSSTISSNSTSGSAISNTPAVAAQMAQITTLTVSNAPVAYYTAYTLSSNETTTIIVAEQTMISTNFSYSITISPDYSADRSNLFILHPKLDWFHDDTVNLTIDGNGLLSTLTTSNADQTGGVIEAGAQTAIQSFELAGSGGLSALGGAGKVPDTQKDSYADVKPVDVDQWSLLATNLVNTNQTLRLGLTKPMLEDLSTALQKPEAKSTSGAEYTQLALVVATNLNNIINAKKPLVIDDFRNANVVLRPETEWLANSLDSSDSERYGLQVKLLNRMLLEDTFPGEIARWNPGNYGLISLPYPRSIDITFNPFDPNEMAAAQAALRAGGLRIQNASLFSQIPDAYTKVNKLSEKKTGGIYYRPAMPYEVRIADNLGDVHSGTVLLPNKSPILHLDFRNEPFVSVVTQVGMTNGFITSYSIVKPSSALAVANVPLTIVNGLTSSLTNLVQLKLNLATGQNSLAVAQAASINALALSSLQQQLRQALAAALTNSAPSNTQSK